MPKLKRTENKDGSTTYRRAKPKKVALTGDQEMDTLLEACLNTTRTKGAEYTGGSPDRLNNFRQAGADIGLPMEKVWYVFFNKHLRALQSYIKNGCQVKSNETIDSRIMDCIVYLMLFQKIVKEVERNNEPKGHAPLGKDEETEVPNPDDRYNKLNRMAGTVGLPLTSNDTYLEDAAGPLKIDPAIVDSILREMAGDSPFNRKFGPSLHFPVPLEDMLSKTKRRVNKKRKTNTPNTALIEAIRTAAPVRTGPSDAEVLEAHEDLYLESKLVPASPPKPPAPLEFVHDYKPLVIDQMERDAKLEALSQVQPVCGMCRKPMNAHCECNRLSSPIETRGTTTGSFVV
ncbi:MAG: hypothetical protein ACYDHY_06650 [Acidiferrobacterales bacterium]